MNKPKSKLQKLLTGALAVGTVLLGVASPVSAADFTLASVTLSDSRPSQTGVTYTFTLKTGTTTTLRCFKFDFLNTPSSGSPTGMNAGSAVAGSISGLTGWSISAQSASSISLTNAGGESVSASSTLSVPFTTITNASAEQTTPLNGPYYVQIRTYTAADCSTGPTDSSVIAFKIQNGVTVAATIDPTLAMSVAGIASGNAYKGALGNVTAGCAYSGGGIQFPSSMSADSNFTCAQKLTVSTNALGGYTVTVRGTNSSGTAPFLKSTTADINDWTGTNASPTAWPATSGQEAFGYTTADATLGTGTAGRFSADDTWAGVATTAAEVAYNSTYASSEETNVGYRLRFAGGTAAGSYQGTLIYVATATF